METTKIPLAACVESSYQNRKELGDVSGLARSIEVNGQITPLIVVGDGESYQLVAGHRRTAAMRSLGIEEADAYVMDGWDDARIAQILNAENNHRRELTEAERGRGIQTMLSLGVPVSDAAVSADIPEDRKINIIALMREAYVDFSRYGVPGLDVSGYDLYHALEAESYTGNLVTNIFAGGTVDTERAFLTGFADQQNYRADTNSYAWYLRSQGYAAEGCHPSYEWFYNRRNVNGYLGLPVYYFIENRFRELYPHGEAPDKVLFPEIFRLYEENRDGAGNPYFSFNVTYQGHGPYGTEDVWRGHHFTDGRYSTETANIVDNYLGSVMDTANQLQRLFNRFRQESRPAGLLVFGDHKPWLGYGNSAYQELGVNLDLATEEGFYNYYSTRYLIWANDAAKAALGGDFTGEGPDVSSCFLMNLLFDQLGWTGDSWAQATSAVWQEIPVLTDVGRYVRNGELTAELDAEGQKHLQTYLELQYYYSTHFQYK